MFTAPMYSSIKTVNDSIPVIIFNGFQVEQSWEYVLTIQLEATPCQYTYPTVYWACPDRLDNVTAIGFRCYYYITNLDTWPCPTTTW